MADLFDVLADPTRRAILAELRAHDSAGGGMKVGQLVTALEISQPTVSKHLKVLREADLVSVTEAGQSRLYSLQAGPLDELEEWLSGIREVPSGVDDSAEAHEASATAFSAWAGAEVGGRVVGRAAADTAYQARIALGAAQEKLQGARVVAEERWSVIRDDAQNRTDEVLLKARTTAREAADVAQRRLGEARTAGVAKAKQATAVGTAKAKQAKELGTAKVSEARRTIESKLPGSDD